MNGSGVAIAGGSVGSETLSRVAPGDRYDDQRGPRKAADLEIPDWLSLPSAEPSPKSDDGSQTTETLGLGRKAGSRYGSVSSLSVKSDKGDSPNVFVGGAIPSPDVASAIFADAMGHAPEASLGDSKTRIDLGLGDLDSPEVARDGAKSSAGGICSR